MAGAQEPSDSDPKNLKGEAGAEAAGVEHPATLELARLTAESEAASARRLAGYGDKPLRYARDSRLALVADLKDKAAGIRSHLLSAAASGVAASLGPPLDQSGDAYAPAAAQQNLLFLDRQALDRISTLSELPLGALPASPDPIPTTYSLCSKFFGSESSDSAAANNGSGAVHGKELEGQADRGSNGSGATLYAKEPPALSWGGSSKAAAGAKEAAL